MTHLLGFGDESLSVPSIIPQALEDYTDVVADGELIVELTAGACRLHHCNARQVLTCVTVPSLTMHVANFKVIHVTEERLPPPHHI